jgi:NAD(P)-dependent dehydrogenase (short-subunit alcohol dehydrogenase family)
MTSRRLSHLLDQALEASVVGSFTSIGPAVRSRLDHWEPLERADGRNVVITGATSGLGLKAAEILVGLGANVHLVGRSEGKLNAVVASLEATAKRSGGIVEGHLCDLSLLSETTKLVAELQRAVPELHVLIHNAGALLSTYTETTEGIEQTLAVHVLSPEILTRGLVHLLQAGHGQVITMTSGGMYSERFDLETLAMKKSAYKGTVAYARAKRAQTLLTRKWNEDFSNLGISAHLVHPGWADTPGVDESLPVFSTLMGPLLRSPAQGVDTLVWLATTDASSRQAGLLWLDRSPRPMHKLRRTKLTKVEEETAVEALHHWCTEQIARALGTESSAP